MNLATIMMSACLFTTIGHTFTNDCRTMKRRPSVAASSSRVLQVAEFGGSGRKTADEYARIHHKTAKHIEDTYAASGELKCGEFVSGAELVGRQDTVVVALHALYEGRTCYHKTSLDQCSIRLKRSGHNQFFSLKRIIDTGRPCPHPGAATDSEDWAILELNRNATDFEPYKPANGLNRENKNVVSVAQSIDIYQPSQGKKYYPTMYSDCKIYDYKYRALIGTDCGASGRSSGSGLFEIKWNIPYLIGIYVGSNETKAIEDQEVARGIIENRSYDSNYWSSRYVPVSGDLERALRKLDDSNPKDQPPKKKPLVIRENLGEDI